MVLKDGDPSALTKASSVIKNGGVIVYPTETLYGIGSSAFNENAIERIYRIKGRSYNKPFIVLIKSADQLSKDFYISDEHVRAYKKLRGIPLTLILKPKAKFPRKLLSARGTIAVRVSSNNFVEKLFGEIDCPLVSTSANISEGQNIYDIKDIIKVFGTKVELIIDSGTLPRSEGSTIIDLTVSPAKILRKGDVNLKDLEDFL